MADNGERRKLLWQRCQDLAHKDSLTPAELAELTGREPGDKIFDALANPCSPAQLVEQAKLQPGLVLPKKFVHSTELAQASRPLNQWCDNWIEALRAHGLDAAPVDYASFCNLTTFGAEHYISSKDDSQRALYARSIDELGNVTGIAAGPALQGANTNPELRASAYHQRLARLDFPTTTANLIRWIRDQGGNVELRDIVDCDVESFAKRLDPPGAPALREAIKHQVKLGSRTDRMKEEILAISGWQNQTATEIMRFLQSRVGKTGTCVIKSYERLADGVQWRAGSAKLKDMDMQALEKRLLRYHAPASRTINRH